MPSPGFFNENENRAYPFVHVQGATAQPDRRLVVDAGFVANVKSRFETGVHRVWLAAVRRQGAFFHLDFASDAPELYGTLLTFSRHTSDPDFASEFVDSGTSGLSESSESGSASTSDSDASPGLCSEPLWSGFVVTGRISAFAEVLPADGELSFVGVVEPALVQNLSEAFVSKFVVANLDRTRVTASADCGEETAQSDAVYVKSSCIRGDVVFVPGYNASVRQNAQANSITFGAAVGDGAGEPCNTVPVYDGETPPVSSSLLEGGPRCNEIVRSVNGVGGPQLNITPGRGVTVTSVPEENKIIVAVNMIGLAVCYDTLSERSESC